MNSKTTIEVKKTANESNMTLVRRFSRRVQEAGIIQTVKGKRYAERVAGKLERKNGAIKRLARRAEIETLKKLGKWTERPTRGGGSR
jgi:ribosomal protein S21